MKKEGERYRADFINLLIGDIIVWDDIPFGATSRAIYIGDRTFLLLYDTFIWTDGYQNHCNVTEMKVTSHNQYASAIIVSYVLRGDTKLTLPKWEQEMK